MAAKVAAAVLSLLVLLGFVACQDPPASSPRPSSILGYPPSSSSPSYTATRPSSSNTPTYSYPPPGPSYSNSAAPSYPATSIPSPSPSSSEAPVYTYTPLGPSPSISNTATYYPPPSPSPSSSVAPTYGMPSNPSPSPSIANTPTYSPSDPSPLGSTVPPTYPTTYVPGPSPSSSAAPPYPPMSSNPIPSPTLGPTANPPSPTSSSLSPPNYPTQSSPSPSPSISISGPTANPPSPSPTPSGPRIDYYGDSCPNAEAIVRKVVKSAVDSDPGTGAGLIRLFFHDCFVQGCDASVLLNTTSSTDLTERQSPPNLSLRGFEVIDEAKAELESACPGVVSCADIVAFASRDATYFLSGNTMDFSMPAGRYDGRVSRSDEALANLPPPTASLQVLQDMFAAKGLDIDDMVTLSGAHTVGRAHCSSFSGRLPPNYASDDEDSMNPIFADSLSQQCNSSGGGGDTTAMQDPVTPDKLDRQYYENVLNHVVLCASDAALLASNQTADMVSDNAFTPGLWEFKFKKAMVKMGLVGVKTRTNGEIRKKCWMVNS